MAELLQKDKPFALPKIMNRNRLLTCLFLIANGCTWLVLISLAVAEKESGAGGFIAINYGILLGLVVPLHLILTTTWACTSKGGYLKRGTLLTVVVFLACFAASYLVYKPAKILHVYLVFYITQVLAVCYGFYLANKWGLLRGGTLDEKQKKRMFQISLKTLFGWMTAIAIFAALFSYTKTRSANRCDLHDLWVWVPSFAVLTVSTIVLLERQVVWWRRWGSLPIAALVLAGLTVLLSPDLNSYNYFYLAGGYLAVQIYLGLGHSVQRLGSLKHQKGC